MKKTPLMIDIKKGNQSNYVITATITAEQKKQYRDLVVLEYQKEATKPWFRKGHVPLSMVEEMLNPGSVMMAVLEEIVNQAVKQTIDTYPDNRWIWQVYALDTAGYKEDTESGTISFHLDVFPEVVEKNDKWKKHTEKAYSTEVTQAEVDATLDQLRSSYAQFDDVDVVDTASLMRLKITQQDKKWEQVGHTKNQYLGQEELSQHTAVQKFFLGKKKGDVVEIDYKKASEITLLAHTGEDTPHTTVCEIIEIKQKILPDLTQEFIDKTFTKDDNITSVDVLIDKIKETLSANKEQNALYEWVDTYLKAVDSSFDVQVPQTLLDEEMKNRLDHLGKQLGGEKWLKAYLERMGEKESQAYIETIKQAALTSIHKYFVLKFVCDELKLDIDRNKNHAEGEVERALYTKIVA
jgi:trigger factor